MLLLTVLLSSCGSDGPNRAVTVEFPGTRPQQALHCTSILSFRIQQIEGVTSEGVVGDWASEDFAEAQQSALREVDPAVVAGTQEEVAATVRETMDAFDANSDDRIDGRAELQEFSRHVDLCMDRFAPEP